MAWITYSGTTEVVDTVYPQFRYKNETIIGISVGLPRALVVGDHIQYGHSNFRVIAVEPLVIKGEGTKSQVVHLANAMATDYVQRNIGDKILNTMFTKGARFEQKNNNDGIRQVYRVTFNIESHGLVEVDTYTHTPITDDRILLAKLYPSYKIAQQAIVWDMSAIVGGDEIVVNVSGPVKAGHILQVGMDTYIVDSCQLEYDQSGKVNLLPNVSTGYAGELPDFNKAVEVRISPEILNAPMFTLHGDLKGYESVRRVFHIPGGNSYDLYMELVMSQFAPTENG